MKAGTVNHQLSHRAMTVHVFGQITGFNDRGSGCRFLNLDEKVLTLAQRALDSDPLRTMGQRRIERVGEVDKVNSFARDWALISKSFG